VGLRLLVFSLVLSLDFSRSLLTASLTKDDVLGYPSWGLFVIKVSTSFRRAVSMLTRLHLFFAAILMRLMT